MAKVYQVSCPKCNNKTDFYRYGKDVHGHQKYQCKKCWHQFASDTPVGSLGRPRERPSPASSVCEKAMFQNSEEAKNLYELASEKKIFVMEALWSRYLPAVQQAKRWVEQEKIGTPTVLQCNIGFVAPDDKENRYFNPKLGGGAAKDITVYAYEITTFILNLSLIHI